VATVFDKPLLYPFGDDEIGVQAERPLTDAEKLKYNFTEMHPGWRFLVTKNGDSLGYVPAYITRSLGTTVDRNTFGDPVDQNSLAKTLCLLICQKLEANELNFDVPENERVVELSTYYDPTLGTGSSIKELQALIKSKLSSEPKN
jgi:hypothetical protein